VRGALITRELENTVDLAEVASRQDLRLADRTWVQIISRQLAKCTRTLHDHHFTHNDLKWRNLLVNDKAELFFIDCPTGSFWWGPCCVTASSRIWPAWTRSPSTTCRARNACVSTCNTASAVG